jgi:hypothetical protein
VLTAMQQVGIGGGTYSQKISVITYNMSLKIPIGLASI